MPEERIDVMPLGASDLFGRGPTEPSRPGGFRQFTKKQCISCTGTVRPDTYEKAFGN